MNIKIGFIGVGNMGTAIIKGLVAYEHIELHGTDRHGTTLNQLSEEHGVIIQNTPAELAHECDYIILAVKPQHAEQIVKDITPHLTREKCLISICAGLPVASFKDWSEDQCPIIRIMPNTPALIGKGVCAICLEDSSLTDTMKEFVPKVFQEIGQAHIIPEKHFDAFTGLIGSGPAYVFYFMDSMIESGVALGLTRVQSIEMVKGLFSGTAELANKSEHSITQLREMVTSPGGTTIKALIHLDRMAVKGNIVDAVFESYLRSVELGQ